MAVAFDAQGTVAKVTGTSVSDTSLTVGAGSNRGLLVSVAVFQSGGLAPVVTATWDFGGTAQVMTQVGTNNDRFGSGYTLFFFGLVNPISGAKTLRITVTNTNFFDMVGTAWTGVSQASAAAAFTNAATATGTADPASVTVTSAVGNAVVALFSIDAATFFDSFNNTTIYNDSTLNFGGSNRANGAASVSMTGTINAPGPAWGALGINIEASAAAATMPVGNESLALPMGWRDRLRRTPNTGFVNQTRLLGQDKIYGAPGQVPDYDWPNPRGPRRSVDLLTWVQSGLALNAPIMPGQNYDWPNPRGPRRSVDLLTWTPPDLVATAAFLPFQQLNYDWPNPRGPKRANDYTHISFSPPGLVPQQASPATITFDWPNPRGPRRSVDLLTWTQSQVHNAQFTPFQQLNYDWPNPRGARRAVDLLTWINTPQIAGPQPFTNYDWPNPKGPRRAVDLLSWSQVAPPQGVPPPTNYDWPNPRGPVRNQTYTLTERNPYLEPFAPNPVLNYDWPNPRGPRRSISLYTLTVSVSPSVAPSVPINPDLMLKNVIVRVRYLTNVVTRIRYIKNNYRN